MLISYSAQEALCNRVARAIALAKHRWPFLALPKVCKSQVQGKSRNDISPVVITEELRGVMEERVSMQQTNLFVQEANDVHIIQE